ncbi:MAG: hypothetical protein O3B76_10245 [Proteobacteria bacterium]|nr:hypothetical protein [Pseudomonadota bacterium]MDA1024043.1 hypothetical protein [Pseudomonadota bacterium]
MTPFHIQFTRFSAFYSPLISTISGGFLAEEGLEATHSIAAAETSCFPDTNIKVLANTIETYQKLGCWSPHVEITKAAYEVTLDVFEHVGRLTKRHAYEDVCAAPPAE